MVTVAIVIPNLNGSRFLRQTLSSIDRQSIKPDEVIISDNHSTDNSLEIIKEFSALNIQVVQPQRSISMSQNWNYAVLNTKSDWLFLLSNDDLLRDTAVAKLKSIINVISEDVAVISFKSEIINEDSKLVLGKYKIGRFRLQKQLEFLVKNIRYLKINAAAVAIKKSAWETVGGFPESYNFLHDLVFYQKVIFKFDIIESKEVLGRYRIYKSRPNSASRIVKTESDFRNYENSDLKNYIKIYPELHNAYYLANKSGIWSLKVNLRRIFLFCFTSLRRIEDKLGISGFTIEK